MNPMKRKSDCPWTSTRKRKKQRKTTESISEHKKTTLAQSDKGSWFDQVKWLDEEELNASVSARKLCSEIDSDDRTEKRNNIVVDINLLNGAIERSLVCKFCQCPVFCEELEERSGQGVRLGFVCTNANCSLIQMPFNSSSKSGKLFDINRASTLAFRAIGRGQLAAAKTLSILGLPKPLSKPVWCENTKIIADACSELVREELEHSARELKELVETDSEGYCTTAVSFDGSWCSRGWCARDGVVAGISLKTGKVLDVIHLSSSCSTCDRLEKLHSEGQLSQMEFLEKQVEHGEVCYLNHDGSAQVRFSKIIIIIIILFHLTTTLNQLTSTLNYK